jgi:hypothetical protein
MERKDFKMGMRVRYINKHYGAYNKIGTVINITHYLIEIDFGELLPVTPGDRPSRGTKEKPWGTEHHNVEPYYITPDEEGNYW